MKTATTLETEWQARQALIVQALSLNRLGINHGKAGNVSLRWHRSEGVQGKGVQGEGVQGEGMLITPSAVDYEDLEPEDLVWMSLDEDPPRIDGRLKPSTEWAMHRDLMRARPDCSAVVHTHSLHASALSCLEKIQREGIPPFHYMIATSRVSRIACAPYARFGTQALSQGMLNAMQGGARACLLAHHGVIAIGETLSSALSLAQEVEAIAMMYSQCLALGGPALLDENAMAEVLEAFVSYRSAEASDSKPCP